MIVKVTGEVKNNPGTLQGCDILFGGLLQIQKQQLDMHICNLHSAQSFFVINQIPKIPPMAVPLFLFPQEQLEVK